MKFLVEEAYFNCNWLPGIYSKMKAGIQICIYVYRVYVPSGGHGLYDLSMLAWETDSGAQAPPLFM